MHVYMYVQCICLNSKKKIRCSLNIIWRTKRMWQFRVLKHFMTRYISVCHHENMYINLETNLNKDTLTSFYYRQWLVLSDEEWLSRIISYLSDRWFDVIGQAGTRCCRDLCWTDEHNYVHLLCMFSTLDFYKCPEKYS